MALWDFDVVRVGEGYVLACVIVVGVASNVFSLFVVRDKEARVIRNFSHLLQVRSQSRILSYVKRRFFYLAGGARRRQIDSIISDVEHTPLREEER